MKNYKDLLVWQRATDFCVMIYQLTDTFPKSEIYGLTSQMRRCVISIPSNIAEGQHRGHIKEYIHFLHIAYGSCAELETQLVITMRLKYIDEIKYSELSSILNEIIRMLNGLIVKLKAD